MAQAKELARVRRRWQDRRRRSIIRGHREMDLDSDQLVMLYRLYTNLMEEALSNV